MSEKIKKLCIYCSLLSDYQSKNQRLLIYLTYNFSTIWVMTIQMPESVDINQKWSSNPTLTHTSKVYYYVHVYIIVHNNVYFTVKLNMQSNKTPMVGFTSTQFLYS